MKSPFLFLVAAVLLLTGCNQPAEAESVSGGGWNHRGHQPYPLGYQPL